MSDGLFLFEASLSGAKLVAPKPGAYGQGEPGGMEVVLRIMQPAPPRKPQAPYELQQQPPVPVKRKKGESDQEYAARNQPYELAMERRLKAQQRYAEEVRTYERAMAALTPRLLAYAQIVGLTSVLQGTQVEVSLTPSKNGGQPLLTGIEVSMLIDPPAAMIDTPQPVAAAQIIREAEEEDGFDDEE